MKTSIRRIILIWLAWAIILIGFQWLASSRFQPKRPDYALEWTPHETTRLSQKGRPYLLELFMNDQVAWDSEYYLSIATSGSYDDPDVPADPRSRLALNYAFLPFYPLMIRAFAFPLRLLGLTPIATSTLAGVLVSALGALMAMVSLYDLTRDELGEMGGIRTAFYLIIFPSGFFLAQVYTEGLFVGLAFASLALIRHERLGWAAALAALATMTRAVGLGLIAPLAWAWFREMKRNPLSLRPFPWRTFINGMLVLLPLITYFVWASSHWGQAFKIVEQNYFSRQLFALEQSWFVWKLAFLSLFGSNRQQMAYYAIEFAAILLGLVSCLLTFRRYPGLALFGFLVLIVSLTSGVAQGMQRYVLAMPSIFLVLGRLGRHEPFDRAWTLASVLLMGLLVTLFTFNMWAG